MHICVFYHFKSRHLCNSVFQYTLCTGITVNSTYCLMCVCIQLQKVLAPCMVEGHTTTCTLYTLAVHNAACSNYTSLSLCVSLAQSRSSLLAQFGNEEDIRVGVPSNQIKEPACKKSS